MIRYFTSHPTAANLLMIFFLVLGLATLPSLRKETFPDFSATQVQVRVIYPGANAQEIEESICQRVEDAIDEVNFIEEIVSQAQESVGTLTIEMQDGGNFQSFFTDINSAIDGIADFPEEVEDPLVEQINRTDQVISLAITGPMSDHDLEIYCEDLKRILQQQYQVSQVAVQGFSEKQIRIEVPAVTLQQYGLNVGDIARTISQQSIDIPMGTVQTRDQEILLRFSDQRVSIQELEKLVVVSSATGAELTLQDIGKISYVFEEEENKILFNGKRAGMLQITKTKSEDSLEILARVKNFLRDQRAFAPPGVTIALTRDVSSIVEDRLQLLLKNGWQGLILVFLTLTLFFNMRFSFWVVMGLPVSFLGALFFFSYIGFSINMITMVGLLLALGLLMDDAIVISENIATNLEKGHSALDAAVWGVKEVAPGVLSSFATTVCVFGPISFLEGNMGKVLQVMPVTLILVLSVSLIEAFLILPNHLHHSLEKTPPKAGKVRQHIEKVITWLRRNFIGVTVGWCIRWRYLVLGLLLMFFFISVAMLSGGILKFQPFPDIDGDVIESTVLLPPGTPLDKTEQVAKRIARALDQVNEDFRSEQPGNRDLIKNINIQYNKNVDANESGPHVVTISVDLLKAEERNARLDHVLHRWRELVGEVPDSISLKFKQGQVGPAGWPIDVRIYGQDLHQMKRASLELQNWLGKFHGVFDLSDDLLLGKPEITIKLREGASSLGLQAQNIAEQLRGAFQGATAQEIQVGTEDYEVDVRFAHEDSNNLSALENFQVTNLQGQLIPLAVVADLSYSRSYSRIARVDGRRVVTVRGDVDTTKSNAREITSKLKKDFLPVFQQKFPQLQLAFQGQEKESQQTGGSMAKGFLIGVIGVFLLLSFQFKSYTEPLLVMVAIPFAFVGVIWGHIFMGMELSMPSMMGFISLAGVVVNDSILLVEFVKMRLAEGIASGKAAKIASQERFRAVMLTSMTTIAGLLPLMFEKSLQAQVLIPLAVSLVFGLLFSTILVLFIIPCLYNILDDFNLTREVVQEHKNNSRGARP